MPDYIQKNEFATNHGVCDECSEIAEKNILCVFCNVCIHLVPDCCCFLGDQLSCIDCYKTRHEYISPHTVPCRASLQEMADRDDTVKDRKATAMPNDSARKEDERTPAAKNEEVANEDDTSKDLKAPPQPNDEARKEDEPEPAALNKKADNSPQKLKEPPKPVDEEDSEDDRKPAAKEDN